VAVVLLLQNPKIAVLLATLNGAHFLEAQLSSLAHQVGFDLHIFASDDGSIDGTAEMVRQLCDRFGFALTEFNGPQKGFSENFRNLILRVPLDFDAYCFCDQDDVWLDDKLARSFAAIGSAHHNEPVLHCSRTMMISETDEPLGLSPAFLKPPSFANALVQSIAGGNTMMMNMSAMSLMKQASLRGSYTSHDWAAYQLISGAGGLVVYELEPLTQYRQHGNNSVGGNVGFAASFERLVLGLKGRYRDWNEVNWAFLSANRSLLTKDAIQKLKQFRRARSRVFGVRMRALWRSGCYRQTQRGTISLWIACALRKM
jgi:glycosyltransferase involved in cell wall biosynthesis